MDSSASPVPAAVSRAVEMAWTAAAGHDVRIASASRVGGGCISPAARLLSAAGEPAFLKWGDGDVARRMFAEEARSLRALAGAGQVRVPAVLGSGEHDGGGWLLLEWLEPGVASAAGWRQLGAALARTHRVRAERFGWDTDNFIGTLPQTNARTASWGAFWRERRLAPQLERARRAGHFGGAVDRRFDSLLESLEDQLDDVAARDGASLLHGDLWGGNVHALADGSAALIDPSSCHGHREVDLAMSELFGGFDSAFHEGYDAEWPLEPGYRAERRAIYQLYYLLVHVNMFGAGYVDRTLAALKRALGE